MKTWRICSIALAVVVAQTGLVWAGEKSNDWPGWRNGDRSGRSAEKNLLKKWPENGPKLAWRLGGLGNGYSTPSVAGEHIYLLGGKDRKDVVIAIDRESHEVVWSTPIGATADGGGYPGPRCTPTVDGDRMYVLGSLGHLACLECKTGKIVWNKNVKEEYSGRQQGPWAYAESPLVDGDVVLASPGGEGAAVVCFNKQDGSEVWKSGAPDGGFAAYSSPIVVEFQGVKQYVTLLQSALVGIDAKSGKQLWSYAKCANGVANCPTPVYEDGFVFCASGYGTGGGLVKLTKKGSDDVSAKEVYFTKDMINHHGGVVVIDGYLYGANERELVCLNFKTGKVQWKNACVGKGSIAYADGHLYVRSEDTGRNRNGSIALVDANPKKYVEKGRFSQPDRSKQAAWPHPVIAGGKLYIRDAENLFCYDVAAKKK